MECQVERGELYCYISSYSSNREKSGVMQPVKGGGGATISTKSKTGKSSIVC